MQGEKWPLSTNRKLNAFQEGIETNGPWKLLLYFCSEETYKILDQRLSVFLFPRRMFAYVWKARSKLAGHIYRRYLLPILFLYGSIALWTLPAFDFFILYIDGKTPCIGDQPAARSLPTHDGINAYRHPCLEWDSNPLSQCSSGRRRFMS
jgi:hypothetical protein